MKKRMFKTHIIVIIYILSPFTSFAQLSNFYKIYPFISETYFIDIDTTHDGGYVACGQTYGPNGGDFVVLKTDSVGNELWRFENNEFDGDSTYLFSNDAIAAMETPDHYIIVAGTMKIDNDTSNNKDLLLAKFDSIGNLVWNKKYNYSKIEGPGLLYIFNNKIYLIEYVYPNSQATLIKFDINGDTLLKKTIAIPTNFIFTPIKMVMENGYFYLCGIADSSSNLLGNSIAKIDTLGNTVYFKYKLDTMNLYTCPDIRMDSSNNFSFLNCYQPLSGIYSIGLNSFNSTNNLFSFNPTTINHSLRWAVLLNDSVFATRIQSITQNPDSFFLGVENFKTSKIYRYGGFAANHLNVSKIIVDRKESLIVTGSYNDGNGYVAGFIMKTIRPIEVGIEKISITPNQIKVFPNPTNGNKINIIINENLFNKSIRMYDFLLSDSEGKYILTSWKINKSNFEISTDGLKRGSYSYSIIVRNENFFSGKIIIN